jgi:hypothetical protein
MKLSSSKFENMKWVINTILPYLKSSYPLTKVGAWMMATGLIGSPFSAIAIKVLLPDDFFIQQLEMTLNEVSIYSILSGLIIATVGFGLIHKELSSNARYTARVLITGLPGTNIDFPEEVLSKTESKSARESVQLGIEEDKGPLATQIERFNSEVCVDLFNRFIVHDNCKKLYIGGLARIPFLVAYGSLLRTLTAEVVYFDKFQRDGKWKKLQEENKKISLKQVELISIPNTNGDVGVAIGFTTPINSTQLPEALKNHTTIISPSIESERNLIQNQVNLESISYEIQSIIDTLSASENVKKIHLFLSVQSSLAIQIGRRYQEGIHRNWVVYNFNPATSSYEWALEVKKEGISKFSIS